MSGGNCFIYDVYPTGWILGSRDPMGWIPGSRDPMGRILTCLRSVAVGGDPMGWVLGSPGSRDPMGRIPGSVAGGGDPMGWIPRSVAGGGGGDPMGWILGILGPLGYWWMRWIVSDDVEGVGRWHWAGVAPWSSVCLLREWVGLGGILGKLEDLPGV